MTWRGLASTTDIQFKVQLDSGTWCDLDEHYKMDVSPTTSNKLQIAGLVTPTRVVGKRDPLPWCDSVDFHAESPAEKGGLARWTFKVTPEDFDAQDWSDCVAIELVRGLQSPEERFLMVVSKTGPGTYQRIGFGSLFSMGQFAEPELSKTWKEFHIE